MSYQDEDEQDSQALQIEIMERRLEEQAVNIKKLEKQKKKQKFVKKELLKIISESPYTDVSEKLLNELPIIEKMDVHNHNDIVTGFLNKVDTDDEKDRKISFSQAMNKVVKKYIELKKLGINKKNTGHRAYEFDFRKEGDEIEAFYSGDLALIEKFEEQQKIEEDEYSKVDWQYCLVFPNPDYDSTIQVLDEDITIELYDKCFKADTRAINEKHQKLLENQTYYNVRELLLRDSNNKFFLNGGNSLAKSKK